MSNQFNLFEEAGLSDTLSRDIVLSKGAFVELPGMRFVRINNVGVKLLEKKLVGDRVSTFERGIAALPMLPVGALNFCGDNYIQLYFATRDGRNSEQVVSLDGLINCKRKVGVRKALAEEGYMISDEQWNLLGPVMRDVIRSLNKDGSLHIDVARAKDWQRKGMCLVPRQKALSLRVIMGGKQTA